MARRRKPEGDERLGRDRDGAQRLGAMFLHQLPLDAHSRHGQVREDALGFLGEHPAVDFGVTLVGLAIGWCPSIACMAVNAALMRIWSIMESSTVFLSSCPPCGRARFQRNREDVVRGPRSEVEIHYREAGLRRR